MTNDIVPDSLKSGEKVYGNGKRDGRSDAMEQVRLYGLIVMSNFSCRFKQRNLKATGEKGEILGPFPPFGKNERAVWNALYLIANSKGWQHLWFKSTNGEIARIAAISERNVIEAKKNLKGLGLIDYRRETKCGAMPTEYRLYDLVEEKGEDGSWCVVTKGKNLYGTHTPFPIDFT